MGLRKRTIVVVVAGVCLTAASAVGVYASALGRSQDSTGKDPSVPVASGVDATPKAPAGPTAAGRGGITLSFRLDPRLTKGLYMGDRWVSPPTYQTALGTVEARAHFLDTRGRRADISGTWMPAAPDMVSVSPNRGHEVKITVHREGQSSLKVDYGDFSKTLTVKAVRQGGVWRVDIVQS